MVKIKVCGLNNSQNIKELNELNLDYMGFIFWKKSKRYCSLKNVSETINDNVKKTGVFVDASLEEIRDNITHFPLDAVQLHGNESPKFCKELKISKVELIKAFRIHEQFDFKTLENYMSHCDYFLFDTYGKLPGGNGTQFNWDILKKYPFKKPFFLSGGIGIECIEQVVKLLKSDLPIFAIDLNSKFETTPGIKNVKLLTSFLKQLR